MLDGWERLSPFTNSLYIDRPRYFVKSIYLKNLMMNINDLNGSLFSSSQWKKF